MFTLCLGLALLSSAHAFPGNRVVNGTDAKPGEIPYIVSVGDPWARFCGGSIINEYWILTAAHCVAKNFYEVTKLLPFTTSYGFDVQYGVTRLSNDGFNTIHVEKYIKYPKYSPENDQYDIALLKLQEPIPFSEFAQPVTLPPAFNATPGGAEAVLAGWGIIESGGPQPDTLQRVNLTVYTDEDCESLHAITGPTNREYHVCAGVAGGGKGQCSGDSGGPLVVNGVQVGVVSWSVKPCANTPYPGVYAKVSSYIDWINDLIAEDEKIATKSAFSV